MRWRYERLLIFIRFRLDDGGNGDCYKYVDSSWVS